MNSQMPGGTRKRRRLHPHLVTLLHPGTFAADRYQLVRHALELKHDGGARIFAVTSPSGGEGKTTTVLNLGGALAKDSAAQVLLVEADLRRPCMLERLGLGAFTVGGLLKTLPRSNGHPPDAIIPAIAPNLWLAPAGGSTASPYELLRSAAFSAFLTVTRARFDYVLIDTPPLLICPEFQVIERWCDATLLVVAANRTPRKQVSEAVARLDRAKALGIVLNGDESSVDSYYRQSSGATRRSLSL